MEKCCLNCRYRNNGICTCKSIQIDVEGVDAVDYIEDGILSDVLHEKLDVKLISNMIIEQLQDKGFLKKNYNKIVWI